MAAQPASLESITVGDVQVTYLPDGDASVSETALFRLFRKWSAAEGVTGPGAGVVSLR